MASIAASAISHLARLGIPDLVEVEPKTAADLARQTGTNADALYRLMRASAAAGVLAEASDGTFHQTPLSAVLRSNAVPSMRAMAMLATEEWQMRGCERLDYCVRTGKTAFEGVYGKPIFEYFRGNPQAAAVFNEAMTNLSMMEGPAVVEAYDFGGIESLTDVGGGHGLLLATILQRNPDLKGTLYDQPSVIEGAKSGPLAAFEDRVSFLSGDMFTSVPPGADAYIMKYIIHDWPDEECFKILRGCRAGVNPGGRLLIVDTILKPEGELDWGRVLDLEMMMFPGGRERTEQQFRDLLSAEGWRLNRLIPTKSSLSIVEAVAA
jgi:O-methyltransferase domain